ncbi:MAG: lantibiotic protection ABC transporter ATP-binding subunit [Erysipelotrichaceae bacterium]|nr:lantibiotic protection ABC transporter ATP-binding subunit [Erysipelotrichaceae bacterium]
MKYILETKQLCKRYQKHLVLKDIDLKVKTNTIYGLLGPNGAGKSTLLKIISGMSQASSGEVFFQGQKFKRQDIALIGALIEEAPIYENLTAYENLKVKALLYGIDDQKILDVLKIVNLPNARKKAGQFSMGMKQRLGIAMALLNDPQLLILDEPTNGLDPVGIKQLRALILSFLSKGMTIIVSSHILSEIECMADEIGIIVDGQLCYQDMIKKDDDLEALFMQVIEKAGGLDV